MKYFDNINRLTDAAASRLKDDSDGFGYLCLCVEMLDYLLLESIYTSSRIYNSYHRQQVRRALKWLRRERDRRRSKAQAKFTHPAAQ